jgi:hypothetical protein
MLAMQLMNKIIERIESDNIARINFDIDKHAAKGTRVFPFAVTRIKGSWYVQVETINGLRSIENISFNDYMDNSVDLI